MNDPPSKPRFRIRTVLIVVAPAVILVLGSWHVVIAALVISEDRFLPNLFILFGGTAVVVTMALAAWVFMGRPERTGDCGHRPSLRRGLMLMRSDCSLDVTRFIMDDIGCAPN
jgi:hypothetical protein